MSRNTKHTMRDRLQRGEEIVEIELVGSELTLRQGGDVLTESVFSEDAARKCYMKRVEELLAGGFELLPAARTAPEPVAGWSVDLSDADHERERHYRLRLSFTALTVDIERHLVINPDYLAEGATVPPEKVLDSRYGFGAAASLDRFVNQLLDDLYDNCFEAYGDDGNALTREALGQQLAGLPRQRADAVHEAPLAEERFAEEIERLLDL